MAMRPCKRCWQRHATAEAARQCWLNDSAAKFNPDVQVRRRAEQREERERSGYDDQAFTDDAETRTKRAAQEMGGETVQYRSADAQLASAANRFVADVVSEGRTMDSYEDPEVAAAFGDFLVDASMELEDVEVFTDDSWTIVDDRMRSAAQASFSLREDEEVPEVSVYDEDHRDRLSPHWHPSWCSCWHCTNSRALSANWSEDDWAG